MVEISKPELIEMLVNPQDRLKQLLYKYLENNMGYILEENKLMNADLSRLGDFVGINKR